MYYTRGNAVFLFVNGRKILHTLHVEPSPSLITSYSVRCFIRAIQRFHNTYIAKTQIIIDAAQTCQRNEFQSQTIFDGIRLIETP